MSDLSIFRAIMEHSPEKVAAILDDDPKLLELEDSWLQTKRRPLASAAQQRQLGLVKMLVARGAEINAADRYGLTALHFAARIGHKDMVTFLLNNGAEFNRSPAPLYQVTPIMEACLEGHLAVVELLFEHAGGKGLDDMAREDGRTMLHCAAEKGRANVAAFLLSKGAQPDPQNNYDRTPLMVASRHGHVATVKVLLSHMGGRGLDMQDNVGGTALHLAVEHGHVTVMRLLLLAGADSTIPACEGTTPRGLSEEVEPKGERRPELDLETPMDVFEVSPPPSSFT